MKNLMKTLFATLVLVAISTSIFAQNAANTTASATATLLTGLTIAKNVDIAYGQVASATSPVMSANSATKTQCGANATLGKFTVAGTAGASVLTVYDASVTLTHSGGSGSGQLKFTPSVYRTELTAATFGATGLTSNTTYTINSSAVSAVAGTDHIFVGGALTSTTDTPLPALSGTQLTGLYTGTFNISVTYN